jgi:hypothetical protein
MVRARGNTVSSRHGFPITHEPKEFKAAVKSGAVKGISLAAQNLIESKQPYNTGNADTSVLWTLHAEDIEDKHRLLVVVAAGLFLEALTVDKPFTLTNTPGKTSYMIGPAFGRPKRLTKEGVELGSAAITEGSSHFDPEAKFSPLIAFEEFGTLKLQSVIPTLLQARDFVLQTIREFDGEFA